jgi:phosphatidylserine decarboxylase
MLRLAPEGYPFILGALVLTVLVSIFFPVGTPIPFVLTAFMVYFFRDPERVIPEGKDLFVAPADGRIILIKEVREISHLGAEMKQVSIFMSPFNVHVNRAPCDGSVKTVQHNRGSFFAAYKDEASIKNENIEMVLETSYGDVLVRQVAGFIARRAVCRKRVGDVLRRGERYGVIKFSSRVDVYLPKDVEINVRINDSVKAGETVIADLKRQ